MRRKSRSLIRWAMLVALCVSSSAALVSAQTIVQSFDGDRAARAWPRARRAGPTAAGSRRPTLAANGKQVVQVTWQNVRTYDYTGKLLQSHATGHLHPQRGTGPHAALGEGSEQGPVRAARGVRRVHRPLDHHLNLPQRLPAGERLVRSPGSVGRRVSVLPDGGPCLDKDPGTKLGYDKNGVYYCGGHGGDDNPQTVPGVAYDCFAVPSAEVKAIAQGTPPAHINRAHNMPLDVVPAIDNNPDKAPTAPAFFMNKSCDRTAPNACQRSTNFSFQWVVNTFTWNGPTGTYNAGGAQQTVKTDIGSTASKWLYNTPYGPTVRSSRWRPPSLTRR